MSMTLTPGQRRLWDSISLGFYSADLGTDIYTFVQHCNNGYVVWAGLTGGFTVMPMLFSILLFAWYVNKTKWRLSIKSLATFCATLSFPLIPFCWMAWNIVANVETHPYVSEGVGRLKLFEAFGESLPQAGLQMFVVFYSLRVDEPIYAFQWITVAVSLGFLSFAVTTSYLFDNQPWTVQVTFFIYFLLAITSRFMVCCVFTLLHASYWFMPIGTELGLTIAFGCCVGYCSKGENKHLKKGAASTIAFSSICNLCFAIGGFIEVTTHMSIRIFTLVLAAINLCANINLCCFVIFHDSRDDLSNATDTHTDIVLNNNLFENLNDGNQENLNDGNVAMHPWAPSSEDASSASDAESVLSQT